MNGSTILIADIGGTNARFALTDRDTSTSIEPYRRTKTYSASDFNQLYDAIDHYLSINEIDRLLAIVVAIAGIVEDGRVELLNSHWSADSAELQRRYRVTHVNLLNDWEAIAYSLSQLNDEQLIPLGGDWRWSGASRKNFRVGAIGPGSGLGVAGLIRDQNQLTPIVTEGGHVGFAAESAFQTEILKFLQNTSQRRVSLERLLSGPGIENLYSAISHLDAQSSSQLSAREISEAANSGDAIANKTMSLFFEILGQVAGDTVLSLGGFDGVFIAGGICQKHSKQLQSSKFRQGFEHKGRYQQLMKKIPSWLITHDNPGLLGASVFAKNNLANT